MKRLGTALLVAAVLGTVATAAPARPDLVLGIEWSAGGGGGQLAWRSATTLKPTGSQIDVGGASIALRAVSPDGAFAALTRTDGQLRIVRLRPLRSAGTLGLGGKYVAAAVWPVPNRLVAVAGGETPAVVVVDTRARRVLSRRSLTGELYGAVAAGKRLLALLAPKRAIGQAQLAVVEGDGSVRTIALPGVTAGFAPPLEPEGTGRMASPGLAVDPEGGRVAVVGLDTLLIVDLETLELQRAATRALARVGKRIEGWSRGAIWLRGDSLAVVARTNSYEGDRPVWTTSGVKLHVLDSPATRVLDETATSATRVGDTLLAFGGTALRGYALDGTLRFELLAGQDTGYVQTAGRYAYVGTGNSTRFVVVDVRAGRVVGNARMSKPTVVLAP
jgi:hypothetical protein